jgi:hypothetical protein
MWFGHLFLDTTCDSHGIAGMVCLPLALCPPAGFL